MLPSKVSAKYCILLQRNKRHTRLDMNKDREKRIGWDRIFVGNELHSFCFVLTTVDCPFVFISTKVFSKPNNISTQRYKIVVAERFSSKVPAEHRMHKQG